MHFSTQLQKEQLRSLHAVQVGSEGQDLLIVLEGTVAMFTNFLGGPYAASAAAAAVHSQAPDRQGSRLAL